MVNSTTTAKELIVPKIADMLIEPLAQASVILQSGVTVFNSSEPLRVPTLTGNVNPAWVGENEEIPESDELDFGEIELMPTNLKSIKTLTRVSNELIRMAKIGVSGVLQRRIVTDVRDKLDTALLTGDGAGNTVTGLINQTGVTQGTWDAADPDSILDALATMAGNEASPTGLTMNGTDFTAVRKLKDTTGRYMLQPDLSSAGRYQLHGIPVRVTNKLPQGTAVLADWADVAIVRDIDPTITLDASRYLEFDQMAIRATTRYDLGVLRSESVMVLTEAP